MGTVKNQQSPHCEKRLLYCTRDMAREFSTPSFPNVGIQGMSEPKYLALSQTDSHRSTGDLKHFSPLLLFLRVLGKCPKQTDSEGVREEANQLMLIALPLQSLGEGQR